MSLTARQCRALDSIEQHLGAREPRLASMFAMFAKLTKDEKLPALETIEVRRWQWLADRKAGARGRQQRSRVVTRFINVALLPLIMVGLLATALAVSHNSPANRCVLIGGYRSGGAGNILTPACSSRPLSPHH